MSAPFKVDSSDICRRLSLAEKLRGKWNAAAVLLEFFHYFSNWREGWIAYRNGSEFPRLKLRSGLLLAGGRVDETLYVFREVFERRVYTEPSFYRPKPSDVVLDIGANLGLFALYLNWRAPGVTVHCFEPGRSTFERLREITRINRLDSKILLHRYAVSNRDGDAYLSQHERTVQRALARQPDQAAGGEPVKTLSLGSALDRCGVAHVDFMKIDIEGAEIELIEGTDSAVWKRIARVALEYHGSLRPGCRESLIAALQDRGLNIVNVTPLESGGEDGILQACHR